MLSLRTLTGTTTCSGGILGVYGTTSLQTLYTNATPGFVDGATVYLNANRTIVAPNGLVFRSPNNNTNSSCQTVVGFSSLNPAFPNVDISAYTGDFTGIGNDVGDANLSFYCHRVAVAGQTANYVKVATNSSFPAHTTTDTYLLRMDCTITYQKQKL